MDIFINSDYLYREDIILLLWEKCLQSQNY